MECSFCLEKIPFVHELMDIVRFKSISEKDICPKCARLFAKVTASFSCQSCGQMLEQDECEDCRAWRINFPPYVVNHRAIYYYNQAMKEWFRTFKFLGNEQLATTFSTVIEKALESYQVDYIIPIPLSTERRAERGFNQVESLLDAARISYTNMLLKNTHTQSQSSKNKKSRLKMEQVFKLKNEYKNRIDGKKILLVDDIYTTGKTIFQAYQVLTLERPQSIASFSLAR
ncbi:ComF family protein [Vagococcus entomophilus]|uniref:Phosphoribosyltransferase domain-containing protein n=1 Tax=Vagococcus entomophilus TaxID=1160095 RepID=A0A430AIJ4_9ENTE|nr:ComF family protein [Vagococcus entomophilus]RSU07910.1 hypothetical protein CBF30_01330 [Vagococcus entomophilus]